MIYYMILLVITSNNILLSLPIALTYHIIPDGSSFDIPNLTHLLLRNAPAAISLIGKHSIYHHTYWDSLLSLLLHFRFTIIKQLVIQAFFRSNSQSEQKRLSDQAHNLLDAASTAL